MDPERLLKLVAYENSAERRAFCDEIIDWAKRSIGRAVAPRRPRPRFEAAASEIAKRRRHLAIGRRIEARDERR